jgi:hypothetical protein
MAEIVQFPRIVNVVPAGTHAHSEMVQVTHDGSLVLTDRARQAASGDWNNQELAELYRVESILLQANIRISTARGVTDENDPWFVFCRENGDVFLHMARIDGTYILDGYGIGSVISGVSFKSLINQFVERSAVREGADNVVQLKRSVLNSDVIRLHPTVMLAALVWTLYLSSTEWMGVAHAADEIAAQSSDVSYDHFSAITGFQAPSTDTSAAINDVVAAPKFSADLTSGQKSEGRDQFHNFYAFLALHGVALGIPVALSEITSPTVTVPQTSELDAHSFQKSAAISFFDTNSTDQQHSAGTSTAVDVPVVEFKHHLSTSLFNADVIHDRAKGHLSYENKSLTNEIQIISISEKIYNEINRIDVKSDHVVLHLNADNIDSKVSGIVAEFISKFNANNYFKLGDVDFSTTLDYQELQKILPQISTALSFVDAQGKEAAGSTTSHTDASQPLVSVNLSVSASVDDNFAKPSSSAEGSSAAVPAGNGSADNAHAQGPSANSKAPAVVIGGTSQYNSAANSFVNELISKADAVEMVKIGIDVVLVDMSALDEQGDLPYMRTWVTDAGFRISTIGHVSDFLDHGLM